MTEHPDETVDPRAWMKYAESSLIRARLGRDVAGVLLADLCFDAQQAAEKSLKALLLARSIGFPKTHALARLLELLEAGGFDLPPDVKKSAALSSYAVWTRYPGAPPVTKADFEQALTTAERVVTWVRHELARRHPA